MHYIQKQERVCEACFEEYLKSLKSAVGGSVGKPEILVMAIHKFAMDAKKFNVTADETDSGSKTSSPKVAKKQDSAPGVLNVSHAL